MTKPRSFAVAVVLATLAGCVQSPPVVSDFNGNSVKVQTEAYFDAKPTPEADAEAARICRAGGAKRAEYASSRVVPQYTAEHLYLCL